MNDEKETGTLREDQSQLMFEEGFSFSGYERNSLRLNLGTGRFLEISGVSGIDSIGDGRASVFADFDNDGDLDVFVTALQGQAHLLFRNNVGQDGGHVRVVLQGDDVLGRDAFGAVVRLATARGIQTKIKSGGSGYLSQHDPRLLFGMGPEESVDAIEVTWPDGRLERFQGPIRSGDTVRLIRSSGRTEHVSLRVAKLPDPISRTERFALGLHLAVGEKLPVIELPSDDGTRIELTDLVEPSRQLLVNVWATWCLPCAQEMPELESLWPRLQAKGIDLVGLNVDTEGGFDVSDFARRLGATYPVYAGGIPAVEKLYATDELTVPMSFILDDTGTVIELIPGWSERTRRRFEELVAEN